jgi:predicted nucleic acid-binding protein
MRKFTALFALGEAEEFLNQFEVLCPNDAFFRLALRVAGFYQLSGFDAQLWAYAKYYGLKTALSEDFSHDQFYQTVRVVDPFR